ncbi:MAG: DUF523 domain-containing protein [Bacillota bacterium]|jgi:uncharacterized protein YbbK (DUF523 family)
MYLVSSCLCGNKCRYNSSTGNLSLHPGIQRLLAQGLAVPVCPEILGGLPVPRPPAEIMSGTGACVLQGKAKVVNSAGDDVTENYILGAWKSLLIGLKTGCTKAVLKARSPACGIGSIYDGKFRKTLIEGDGVLAALLKEHGFLVFNDEDFYKHFSRNL